MNGRNWVTCDDTLRDDAVRAAFDQAVEQVNAGTAQPRGLRGDYPIGFIVDGHKILGTSVLEYAITRVPAAEFDAQVAWTFTARMRALLGWNEIDYTLHQWVEKRLRDPFFVNEGSSYDARWRLKPDSDPSGLPDSFFTFACHIAIGDLLYGPSYASVSADRIFGWVTALGSDLPSYLKKHGTGQLPAELITFTADGVTAKANDALAQVRIVIKDERAETYAAALDYLHRLLTTTDFPRSYAIEFRGPTKAYLQMTGLPKKGVNQLFACAATYPALHGAIERYARAAILEFEWYTNIDDEDCAMPGTFAVFALGLADSAHAPLVIDYLNQVDGEHQSMHSHFVEAYIDAHGFTPEAIAYLLTTAGNIQHLRHRKKHASLMANRESLEALLSARHVTSSEAPSGIAALQANLADEPVTDYSWRAGLYAIWGDAAEQRDTLGRVGGTIIDAAPEPLRALYEEVFA